MRACVCACGFCAHAFVRVLCARPRARKKGCVRACVRECGSAWAAIRLEVGNLGGVGHVG